MCCFCKHLDARPYEYPNHSDIPELCFGERNPSSSTGVNYLGLLLCLPVCGEKEKLHKAFIVIYTHAATRSMILEVVNNANANTFRNSFKRFICR